MKVIKLIYDKYENEIGFVEGSYEKHTHQVIESINDELVKKDRELTIYTWGLKKHIPVECDIIFDSSLFSTKVEGEIKHLSGLDDIIQQSIINHPLFDSIMERILIEIETNNPTKIAFVCNYGKHRSVGWAEIVKQYYYPQSKVIHKGL